MRRYKVATLIKPLAIFLPEIYISGKGCNLIGRLQNEQNKVSVKKLAERHPLEEQNPTCIVRKEKFVKNN